MSAETVIGGWFVVGYVVLGAFAVGAFAIIVVLLRRLSEAEEALSWCRADRPPPGRRPPAPQGPPPSRVFPEGGQGGQGGAMPLPPGLRFGRSGQVEFDDTPEGRARLAAFRKAWGIRDPESEA